MTVTVETLRTDLTAAMRSRDAFRTGVLRQIIGALTTEEKSGATAHVLDGTEVVKVLAREVKKRRESVDIYKAAGAPERAEIEASEADLIEEYLPAQLSDAELGHLVADAIHELNASSVKDMGSVMKLVISRAGAAADGKKVSALVRASLT